MKKLSILIAILTLTAFSFGSLAPQNGYDQFQKALAKERGEGNLEEAIALYQKVIEESKDESLSAKAQFRIGICYEKLGREEAQKAFQKVIDNYPAQIETVKEAREKLTLLLKARNFLADGKETPQIRRVWEGSEREKLRYGSISPDGRYLSFIDWNNDLSLYEIDTGEILSLTNKGSGDNSNDFALTSVWSPDSRQIAYDWYVGEENVEIRVVGLDGSKPRVLYRGAWAEVLDWSPDKKDLLAWVEGKDKIYQMAIISISDGSVRSLKAKTANKWPLGMEFSHDGKYIVYDFPQDEKTTKRDIFLISRNGGRDLPLIKHPADERIIGWTPDGKHLIFGSDRTGSFDAWIVPVVDGAIQGNPQLVKPDISSILPLGFTEKGSFFYVLPRRVMFDIYVSEIDPLSGDISIPQVKYIKRFEGTNYFPRYSPNGRFLTYVSENRIERKSSPVICIRSLESEEVREFPVNLRQTNWPIWSPDGRYLLVSGGRKLYSIDTRDGAVSLLVSDETEAPLVLTPWTRMKGEWTSDGRGIFYVITDSQTDISRVVYRNLEDGSEKDLYRAVPGERLWMSVSPEGQEIAVMELAADRKTRTLKVIPANEQKPSKLCTFKDDSIQFPAMGWTPDSKYIYFSRIIGEDAPTSVWRIEASGGEPQRLGSPSAGLISLSFHPDGKRVVFSGYTIGKSDELWVMENFLPGEQAEGKGGKK